MRKSILFNFHVILNASVTEVIRMLLCSTKQCNEMIMSKNLLLIGDIILNCKLELISKNMLSVIFGFIFRVHSKKKGGIL